MLAFVFPGQGSQVRGMGVGLFDDTPEFNAIERDIDDCLGYSIRKLCLEDPGNCLKLTEYTQPAMFIVNALHYYRAKREGQPPVLVAGHSVGEYNALLAANAFDFLTGLRLVQKRGEIMSQCKNGGMAAIIGLTSNRVEQILRESACDGLDIANYNAPAQTVIAGPVEALNRSAPQFEKAGAQLFFPLPVSGAFHSRYMTEAKHRFADFIAGVSFESPTIPVISNLTGRPYPSGSRGDSVRSQLIEQIDHPVLWEQSVRYMMEAGATTIKEVGTGTVLTRLLKQIQQSVA